ncbi:probable calcium-binding protein CML16 [Momordica charantia]|uniref:Probable calcium-binding protein CML16 n=1 Tax=Momordica charantia TaxID=3673 RepID=A0A6J1D725_MOMCH|nr:probable calcium-binding protein CML16 [Momordica charantia]
MASIQSDQLKQLQDIFRRFDMNSDGSLTQLELGALLRSLGIKPSGDQLHSLLSNMDSNGNGSIEFEELVNAILPDMNDDILVNQEQLLEVFRSFDRDGNGYITASELAGSMAKMGQPLSYRELSEMMRLADIDGDGVISFNEFTTVMAKSAADFLGLTFA